MNLSLPVLIFLSAIPIQAMAATSAQLEANNTECPSLDGFYSYYSAENDAQGRGSKVGLNSLIRRASVFGIIQGVILNHKLDLSLLLVEVLGSNLSSAIEPSMLEKVVRYHLQLTCVSGIWAYRTNISGTSDGTPVESSELFYFSLDANRNLIIRNESKGSARLGGVLRKAWEAAGVYKFSRLEN